MIFFWIAVLAGVLTVLAPCILPLLPIIIGSSSVEGNRKISAKSIRIIFALALSVIVFTLLLKASTTLIVIPNSFWSIFSGTVIGALGLVMIFPDIWMRIPFVKKIKDSGNKKIAEGYNKKNNKGDFIVGFSLGPVFSTCSPTYLFIIATVLPAGFLVGLTYLIGFVIGMIISLLLVAFFGQTIVNKITTNSRKAESIKKIFGFLVLIVGLSIVTGLDKKLEAYILDSGYGATINLEEQLINEFGSSQSNDSSLSDSQNKNGDARDVNVPEQLKEIFPETDWSNVESSIEKIISGGPGKDGIPTISNPQFISISGFPRDEKTLAVVVSDQDVVKAYPYNILTWHEIVNDSIGKKNISVTFCPLCGSAVVYDRDLPEGKTTFDVSGFLIESNMVMYDRDTESLWQQSTGKSIAGEYLGLELDIIQFQLLKIEDVWQKYPNALVLSENTGYVRNYGLDPYSGYEYTDSFIFPPSKTSSKFEQKNIMVAFNYNEIPMTFSKDALKQGMNVIKSTSAGNVRLVNNNGEINIYDEENKKIPFYFEMWFSWNVQNSDNGEVVKL